MPWNSTTTNAVVGMTTSNVALTGYNGDTVHAYAAIPEGRGALRRISWTVASVCEILRKLRMTV